MPLLYTEETFLDHKTGDHPESPQRLDRLFQFLDTGGLQSAWSRANFTQATPEQIGLVHDRGYIESVEKLANGGGGRVEADTVVSPRSYDVARLACGAGIAAVDAVIAGEDRRAACLVRPPGHHAIRNSAMGFCLFNNVAVSAAHAQAIHGLERILIVDWDVHHGNGTQDIFYRSPNVHFFSVHRHPFYPGTGTIDETGEGPGLGTTINLPVRFGTPRDEYFSHFRIMLEDAAEKCRPELVLISAGFDSHRLDPIGSLGLETSDFAELTRLVVSVAESFCGGRIISLLEGGYNIDVLPDCVGVHLDSLAG